MSVTSLETAVAQIGTEFLTTFGLSSREQFLGLEELLYVQKINEVDFYFFWSRSPGTIRALASTLNQWIALIQQNAPIVNSVLSRVRGEMGNDLPLSRELEFGRRYQNAIKQIISVVLGIYGTFFLNRFRIAQSDFGGALPEIFTQAGETLQNFLTLAFSNGHITFLRTLLSQGFTSGVEQFVNNQLAGLDLEGLTQSAAVIVQLLTTN